MASGGTEPGVGGRVAAARRRLGWNKEALAFHSGLSWAAISQIESGRRPNPRLDTLASLARALEVSVDYLAGGPGLPMLRHHALIYEKPDDLVDAAASFLAGGVREGEATMAVLNPAHLALLRDRLGDDADGVTFDEADRWYTNPAEAVAACREFATASLEQGVPWIRFLGEIPWSGSSKAEIRLWARYEALLNLLFASTPATVVCAYDVAAVSEEILSGARATHTHMLVGTEIEPSPTYVDPCDYTLS